MLSVTEETALLKLQHTAMWGRHLVCHIGKLGDSTETKCVPIL